MLRPFKVVDTSVFATLVRYEVGELVIGRNVNVNTHKFYVNSYVNNSYAYIMSLSVEELRYCCGFSQALLQAVWDYYDKGDTTIDDIKFVGISKEFDIDELIEAFKLHCDLAITESNNFDDVLDAIEDQIDMLKNEISIYRVARKIKLFKGASDE